MATRTPRPDAPPDPNPHPAPHPRLELPVPPNRSRGPQSNRPQPLPYLQHTIPLPHRTAPQPHAEGPSHRDLRERCAARVGGRQATPVSLQSMSPILLSSLCRSRQSSQPKGGRGARNGRPDLKRTKTISTNEQHGVPSRRTRSQPLSAQISERAPDSRTRANSKQQRGNNGDQRKDKPAMAPESKPAHRNEHDRALVEQRERACHVDIIDGPLRC